jgi:ABC-type sugar transport system permease subunit
MAVITGTAGAVSGRVARRLDRLSEKQFALLVSIPGLLLLFLIVLPPTLAVFGLSTFRIELAKDDIIRNVGLNNFLVRLPADREILEAIPRTLGFAALTTALTLPLALITALVLNRGFRGSGLFFMVVLLPWAIASVVAGVFWRFIFDTHFGIVNGILIALGMIDQPVNWLQNTNQAISIAIVAQAWRSVPLLAVLLLAALHTIPRNLYRAARMDGATSWDSFRHITLPAVRPTLIVIGVLQIILGLQVFDMLYTLTSGGPGRATYVLIYAIYEKAFADVSLGYASAITVVLFFIIVACSMLLLLFQARRRRRPEVIDDEETELSIATQSSLRFERSAADEAAVAALPSLRDVPMHRPLIRLPPVVSKVAFGVLVGALVFFFVAPIAWMVIASLQTDDALSHMPPQLSFSLWTDGYVRLLQARNWQGSFAVSLMNAIGTTFFVIVLASPAAYSLARFRLPGQKLILGVLIFLQMVPGIVMAIPVLRIFQILGLKDTVQALIIVNTAFWLPLIVWLLRNFFAEVPIALERAARIDGCTRLGTLFRVTVPAARPGIAAAAILILIGTWNEFLFAVILGDRNAVTVTRLITAITAFPYRLNESPPPNLLAAGAILAVVPCLLLVLLFHRRIITGLSEGFVKG